MDMNRILAVTLTLLLAILTPVKISAETPQPNIVICMADDWGWPHSPLYGDKVVKTPTFERIAKQGALFNHAYVSSPSCTPSRNAVLTGQYHWRLGPGANLWSQFPKGVDTYPRILEKHGYHIGSYRKSFGPGHDLPSPVAGKKVKSVDTFLEQRPAGKPFCFWFGSSDPHRGYKSGSGAASGMKLDDVLVPPYYPDNKTVRSDICDYYFEVQRFDREVGQLLDKLEKIGELRNTIVVMTGDHGWPFPRGKSNLYDSGTRVPLAIMWGDQIKKTQAIDAFVSFVDLAPTFLNAAGIKVPSDMSGKTLLSMLKSPDNNVENVPRDHVIFGKERHTPCQEKGQIASPARGIRTNDFLYIHNFFPDRWPAGAPRAEFRSNWGDCDEGPTKNEILKIRNEPNGKKFYQLSFAKRPQDELYDVKKDPHQIHNLATDPKYAETLKTLRDQLMAELTKTDDLRMQGKGHIYESYGYRDYTDPNKKPANKRRKNKQ